VVDTVSDLLENFILDQVGQVRSAVADVGVHPRNKIVVGDLAIGRGRDQAHQVVNFVILDSDLKSSESVPQLLLRDDAVTVYIEKLEGFLKVEILDVERSSYLVQSLVQPNSPQILSLKLSAEGLQVHFANTVRVRDPPQDPLVLNRQR